MGPKTLWPEPEPDTCFWERSLKRRGYRLVAGLDEVGRGPLAGPVVAACVILPEGCDCSGLVDSKIIPAAERLRLYRQLRRNGAKIGLGMVPEKIIDRINILQASLLAMKKAVQSLAGRPDYLLVDGNQLIPMTIPQQYLVRGESKSASIAAASIVAKVVRDRLMARYHRMYPAYNFRCNKGYATLEHRQAIEVHGPCAIHRQTFNCVRQFVGKT